MKKIFLILILFLFTNIFTACTNSKDEPILIGDHEIFSGEENKYLVFFEKDGCSGCEAVYPSIVKYLKDKDRDLPNVYMVNVEPTDGVASTIYRKFTQGNTGQGTDGDFYVNGVSEWGYLYIAATPALILVEEKDGVKKAQYIAQGTTKIEEYLTSLLEENK